ncbi:metalloregulator ArsR/SmtB family transcription factor [Brachybacterium sp. NBEC-018]|uniref:ArsR/SmtB family transcription factor n=1 Tax=Brachybacterium sp. NBEC-018 TaxID=2996004 RepID=UPI00217525D5|nr:metalloregulator ArsR/SmtB family transcription factor [Brachybacterium sp. NBEC-018]UVY84993.1 metalloregulator ArsR/SmtB family transcription factor [Brachybacterium sp. NBEC-018]
MATTILPLRDVSPACCALGEGPLGAPDAERLAVMLKALADPMRLRVLSHVAAQGCEEVAASDLTEALGISQPTVSHHLSRLVDAGLLVREQQGRRARYTVVPEAFGELRRVLDLG